MFFFFLISSLVLPPSAPVHLLSSFPRSVVWKCVCVCEQLQLEEICSSKNYFTMLLTFCKVPFIEPNSSCFPVCFVFQLRCKSSEQFYQVTIVHGLCETQQITKVCGLPGGSIRFESNDHGKQFHDKRFCLHLSPGSCD